MTAKAASIGHINDVARRKDVILVTALNLSEKEYLDSLLQEDVAHAC